MSVFIIEALKRLVTSKNKNQKGRNDQKYCNNLYLNTGKTCKEIDALNKRQSKKQFNFAGI